MGLNIVLVEPEIPQNTGNIARTCSATGSKLHIVRPMGFFIDDKKMKRAGLDYWNEVEIIFHDSLQTFLEKYDSSLMFCISTKGAMCYTDVIYPDECFLLFGKETAGLPGWLIEQNYERALRIPMQGESRSLNLSNSAAILTYEYYRQRNFRALN
ncbi:MAG: tRNA (uridine(34)/cytosine(34)/5-carboxymethylaminomethyluridine(34)-2'-O)-methyltransferase TrmL [Deltaproteobacteria bacterium]